LDVGPPTSPTGDGVLPIRCPYPYLKSVEQLKRRALKGCLGDLLGMKKLPSYIVIYIYGLQSSIKRIPIKQPGFNGK